MLHISTQSDPIGLASDFADSRKKLLDFLLRVGNGKGLCELIKGLCPLESKGLNMAHIIDDTCCACGACMEECPEEAIAEGDPIYIIDAGKCTDCESCVEVCPTESIHQV